MRVWCTLWACQYVYPHVLIFLLISTYFLHYFSLLCGNSFLHSRWARALSVAPGPWWSSGRSSGHGCGQTSVSGQEPKCGFKLMQAEPTWDHGQGTRILQAVWPGSFKWSQVQPSQGSCPENPASQPLNWTKPPIFQALSKNVERTGSLLPSEHFTWARNLGFSCQHQWTLLKSNFLLFSNKNPASLSYN